MKDDLARDKGMRRKPDLLWVLVFVFGLGMVTTGYTQSQWQQGKPVAEALRAER
ncbi:hypothetical protein [Pseudomonas sp. URMO17WK12:I4]|uniref:hypothetical protein n=1 Tax=Pseudomonas sp. URMO17WK12:I4 TaxID=1283292 RepID=UPI0012DC959D|nr:hypothetical protein [Pseudomonas sp. URMO17WK12:I4]